MKIDETDRNISRCMTIIHYSVGVRAYSTSWTNRWNIGAYVFFSVKTKLVTKKNNSLLERSVRLSGLFSLLISLIFDVTQYDVSYSFERKANLFSSIGNKQNENYSTRFSLLFSLSCASKSNLIGRFHFLDYFSLRIRLNTWKHRFSRLSFD